MITCEVYFPTLGLSVNNLELIAVQYFEIL